MSLDKTYQLKIVMDKKAQQKIQNLIAAKYIQYPSIVPPSVWHGFFGRHVGNSTGGYSSLNCGIYTGDEPDNIRKNIKTVLDIVNKDCGEKKFKQICLTHQIHSNIPIYIEKANKETQNVEADAIISDTKGILLAIQTADCVPILVLDNDGQTVASIHAGWRGAISGIIQNTIDMMKRLKGQLTLIAIIGPAIHKENYVVDQEFKDNIIQQEAKNNRYFSEQSSKNKFKFDLIQYCKDQLLLSKIEKIYDINLDTYSNASTFFSYRYAAKNSNNICGRQLSLIGIK